MAEESENDREYKETDTSGNINEVAKQKRNDYIRRTAAVVSSPAKNTDTRLIDTRLAKNRKKESADKSSGKNTAIEDAAKNKKSLVGKNNKSKADTSKLLGKNKDSAIRSNSKKKSLAKYAGKTSKRAAAMSLNAARTASAQIKKVAVDNKIREITSAANASDMVELVGEHGIRAGVKFLNLVVNFMLKTIGALLKTAISAIAPYFVIALVAVLLLFVPVLVVCNASDSSTTSVGAGTGMAAIGSVKRPRIEGTSTALTYKEVSSSPWYSAHVSDNGTPFAGDNGLDRLRGDRGGNCTAYVWGRRCELEGQRTELGCRGDAFYWYTREISSGIYKCGQKAKVGAVVCWSYGSCVNGHVAIIEKINKDGSIVTSNSAYGSTTGIPILFYNVTYKNEQELKNAYAIFQGYIYMEKRKK